MNHLDPIEAEMATGSVVARDKFIGRRFRLGLAIPAVVFACVALGGLVAGALTSGAAAVTSFVLGGTGVALALMFAFAWATLTVIRTVLTDDTLHVQCGLWGPRIALGDIVACDLDEERGRRSVGTRLERDGWTTRFLLAGGKHVRVKYESAAGKTRIVRFTAEDPEGLVRKINAQRSATTGVRFDAADDEDAAAEREAEAIRTDSLRQPRERRR